MHVLEKFHHAYVARHAKSLPLEVNHVKSNIKYLLLILALPIISVRQVRT